MRKFSTTLKSSLNDDDNENKDEIKGIKSIIISENIHIKLKKYCMGKKLRIGPFIETLILNHIKCKVEDKAAEFPALTTNEFVA